MTSFGKFWFRYIAPESDNPLDPSIDFSVTAEANLPDILRVFESFLKANGYDLDDRKLSLSRKAPNFNSNHDVFPLQQHLLTSDYLSGTANDVIVLGGK
jgi:hypothetical protein